MAASPKLPDTKSPNAKFQGAKSRTAKFRISDLTFGYDGAIVQHDVSFDVGAGSIFAIMGPSGCGKSTLMKTMIGLLRPKSGTIQVGDEDYWNATEARRVENRPPFRSGIPKRRAVEFDDRRGQRRLAPAVVHRPG